MAQWGNTDNAANSVNYAVNQYGKTANSDNRTAFFGNTTPDAFVVGETVGQFAVDATEMAIGSGVVVSLTLTSPGSGYFANATVTVSGGGGSGATANAAANTLGRISQINLTAAGSSYESAPTVTIAAPAPQSFNANTGVAANGFISIAGNRFQVNDLVTYSVAAGNTKIAQLTSNTQYIVKASNTTGVYLGLVSGGPALTLTPSTISETGHTLQGETATAAAVVGGAANMGVAHAGWVVRTVGSGGRAGRVTYETLVAMGSIATDAADDTILPDA